MSQTYRIREIRASRDWEGQYGPMVDYQVVFETGELVTIAQKQQTAPPYAGQELTGDIMQSTYGPKFKKAQGQHGGGRTVVQTPYQRPTSPPRAQSQPDRSKEHLALELAVRAFKPYEASDSMHIYMQTIGMLADEFYKAIDQVGRTPNEPLPDYQGQPMSDDIPY